MIEMKEAVRLAKQGLSELYEGLDASALELEAIERTNGGLAWTVTLGFDQKRRSKPKNPLAELTPYRRVIKYVTIDAERGEFLSMKGLDS